MGAGQNQVGGPVHGGFTETFERPFQVRHALVEFRLARFKPVHVALKPIHAPGDNSPPDQDQAGKSDSNARLRFWNDIPGRIIPSHHGTRKSRLRIPCAPHPADFGPCRDAAVEPAPPLRPARPCLSSSPQPFAFRVKRGHFEHDRPVRAAENRDVEFAPRLHVPGPDERKGDRFPDRIPVRA